MRCWWVESRISWISRSRLATRASRKSFCCCSSLSASLSLRLRKHTGSASTNRTCVNVGPANPASVQSKPGMREHSSVCACCGTLCSRLGSWQLTPRSHRVRQRIMHSFYDIPHHVPVHVWGCNPSEIMVVHMHFSVTTTIDKCETHFGAR